MPQPQALLPSPLPHSICAHLALISPGKAAGLEHMGELDCAPAVPDGKEEDPLECAGIGTGMMMAAWSINSTVHTVLAEGLCTDSPAYARGLANVLVQVGGRRPALGQQALQQVLRALI